MVMNMVFRNRSCSPASCLALQKTKMRENAVRPRRSSPQQLQWKQTRKDLSWLFSTRSGEAAADVKNEADSRRHQRDEMDPCLLSVWEGAGGAQEQIRVAFQDFQAPPNLLHFL